MSCLHHLLQADDGASWAYQLWVSVLLQIPWGMLCKSFLPAKGNNDSFAVSLAFCLRWKKIFGPDISFLSCLTHTYNTESRTEFQISFIVTNFVMSIWAVTASETMEIGLIRGRLRSTLSVEVYIESLQRSAPSGRPSIYKLWSVVALLATI